jgi:hypothetical protein
MAVTITRTPWIDDDGTGTTGTVINNAVKTALYNDIDGGFAKLAQLAGGNSFTGNQAIAGTLNTTGNILAVGAVPGGGVVLGVQNTAAGAASITRVHIGNDVDTALMAVMSFSSTYTPSGFSQPNGTAFYQGGVGGVSFIAANSLGAIRFYTGGGLERLRIAATGELLVGTPTPLPGYSQAVGLLFGSTTGAGLVEQNVSGANTGNFHVFLNSAGALAGYIAQSGATGVIFGTASDERLKVDGGRASDLTALHAVVVHDFTWKADGVRDRGIFAQEAHALFPRAVTEGTDDLTESGDLARPWGTDYSKFVPDLIVGWQQHDADLADLRAQLATLKGSH